MKEIYFTGLYYVTIVTTCSQCIVSYIDVASNEVIVERYKSHEPAYVDQVNMF